MTLWKTPIVIAACLLAQAHAFALPKSKSPLQSALFVLPDEPFQDASTSSRSMPRTDRDPGQYRAQGRGYYRPRDTTPRTTEPPPAPDQRYPAPSGGLGYGMEAREAFAPRQENILQGGGTRKTWQTGDFDQTSVAVGSDGRPIYTRAQVWEGPNNTPASMTLYSEDGRMQPWRATFQNKGTSSVLDMHNTGPVEFPVEAQVYGQRDGTRGLGKAEQDAVRDYAPSPEKVTQDVQGGSLKYFQVKSGVAAVMLELFSEGRPMYATVELWQGPNNIKQCAEIYSDNGNDRVWSAIIETHGRECTVAVRNIGPALVYPFKASVDPIYD